MGTKAYTGGNTARPIDECLTAMTSVGDLLTAAAGGTQAAALLLAAAMNNVSVVATAADSVKLPLSTGGQFILVTNSDSTDSMQVFGSGTDTINGVATATGVAQAAGKSALYYSTKAAPAGTWFRILSA